MTSHTSMQHGAVALANIALYACLFHTHHTKHP